MTSQHIMATADKSLRVLNYVIGQYAKRTALVNSAVTFVASNAYAMTHMGPYPIAAVLVGSLMGGVSANLSARDRAKNKNRGINANRYSRSMEVAPNRLSEIGKGFADYGFGLLLGSVVSSAIIVTTAIPSLMHEANQRAQLASALEIICWEPGKKFDLPSSYSFVKGEITQVTNEIKYRSENPVGHTQDFWQNITAQTPRSDLWSLDQFKSKLFITDHGQPSQGGLETTYTAKATVTFTDTDYISGKQMVSQDSTTLSREGFWQPDMPIQTFYSSGQKGSLACSKS